MDRKTVLVTGGTGFLGSEIIKALVQTNAFKVIALDINPPSPGTKIYSHVDYVRANILKKQDLTQAFKKARPTIVVHSASLVPPHEARYDGKDRAVMFELNVTGTKNVIEAAKKEGVKGLVYTSSFAVVVDDIENDFPNVNEDWPTGNATLVYGQSKTAAETLILSENSTSFRTCCLRPAIIFGPNDISCIPVIHSLIPQLSTPFIIGSGLNLCDFVFVSNVADAHVLAVQNLLGKGTAAGEAFFISNGEPVPFRDFCVAVWKEFGHYPPFELRIPKDLAVGMGAVAEWLGWALGRKTSLSRGSVRDACAVRYVSIEKARKVLGYQARVSLPEALNITCEHFRERGYGSKA